MCVCAQKQDCGFADVEGVHVASISLHACMRVYMYAMVCHRLYMRDIHLSHVQLPLCLLQLRGLRWFMRDPDLKKVLSNLLMVLMINVGTLYAAEGDIVKVWGNCILKTISVIMI